MLCTASETEGVVVHVRLVSLLTVSRRLFCCSSLVSVFEVRVSETIHLMCVHIILSWVSVVEWPPADLVDHMFSL